MKGRLGIQRVKLLKRMASIAANSLRNVVVMLTGALVAWLVIRQSSAEVWGSVVQDLIFISLSVHVLGWGNKEYLLRKFSQSPATLAAEFYGSLVLRAQGLIFPAILIFAGYEPRYWPWMLLWLLAQFVYQSFDVLVTYHRRFFVAGLVEIITLSGVVAGLLYFRQQIDHFLVVRLLGISYLIRTGLLMLLVRMPQWHGAERSSARSFLVGAFPFFLVGLSGLLGSRMDLYITNFLLSKEEVGEYQVIANIFLFLQSGSVFILLPFAKNVYRLELNSIRKVCFRLLQMGVLLMVPGMPMAYVVLNLVYGFQLDLSYYLYGLMMTLPSFFFLPVIFLLYKEEEEKKVLLITFISAFLTSLFTVLLIPYLGNKGGLLAKGIVQLVVLAIYSILLSKKFQDRAHTLPKL